MRSHPVARQDVPTVALCIVLVVLRVLFASFRVLWSCPVPHLTVGATGQDWRLQTFTRVAVLITDCVYLFASDEVPRSL